MPSTVWVPPWKQSESWMHFQFFRGFPQMINDDILCWDILVCTNHLAPNEMFQKHLQPITIKQAEDKNRIRTTLGLLFYFSIAASSIPLDGALGLFGLCQDPPLCMGVFPGDADWWLTVKWPLVWMWGWMVVCIRDLVTLCLHWPLGLTQQANFTDGTTSHLSQYVLVVNTCCDIPLEPQCYLASRLL